MLKTLQSPPYRGDNGHWLTDSLFYEQWLKRHESIQIYNPVFSLYEDQQGLINARTTFLMYEDPTGYRWAMRYLGSYQHWERLMESEWFHKAVSVWKRELNAKLKADAIEKIRSIAGSGSPQALAASKYLADADYDQEKNTRGRPSRTEMKGELKRLVDQVTELEADGKRIGIN